MATRAQKYGQTYVPAVRLAARWEQIQADIESEQERSKAASDVAARERAALSDLTARYEVAGVSADVLAGYLAAVGAETRGAVKATAAAKKAQDKADEAARKILQTPSRQNLDALIAGGISPEPKLRSQLITALAGAPEAAAQVEKLKPAKGLGGPSKDSIEQRELIRLTSPDAAYNPVQQPALDARAQTAARTKGAEALSEAQVLAAYTNALEGGRGGNIATRFAAALGPLAPAEADPAALLAEAAQIYGRVRQEGSFARAERKYYAEDWLAAADASRTATEEAERLKPGYSDPAREAARRELRARGLDPDDKYAALKGDRRYDYLTSADRIYGEVSGDVRPATPEQTKIAEFVSFLKRTGEPLELKKIERELGKTLKGPALAEGVGFALALARSESERPEDRKTQADLQREATATAERLKEIESTKAAAKLEQERVESALQAEIEALTRQAAETASTQGQLTQVVATPVRRTGAEIEADARRQARREDRFGLSPKIKGTEGKVYSPDATRRSRESLEAELFPPEEGPRTVTLSSGPGREVPPPASPFDPLQTPSLDQRATETVVRSLREGGDLRTNALRLRALGFSNEQIRALVTAARSVPTVEVPPEPAKLPGEFVDWSDPKKTVYRRDPATGVIYGPDGKAITSQRAMAALGVVEAGDTPANRAKLAKLQQPPAPKPPPAGRPPAGPPSAGQPPAGQSPTATPADPFARRLGESDADYAKRLSEME